MCWSCPCCCGCPRDDRQDCPRVPALPCHCWVTSTILDKDPRTQFRAWRRQYGDVFSLYLGGRLVVVLNGFPVIKEALVKFGDVFSDRPRIFTIDRLSKNKGNE